MSAPEQIEITREELFARSVDEGLARERAHRPADQPPPPVSRFRAIVMDALFYLPVAAAIGALASWAIASSHLDDNSRVIGEVVLVNKSPFDLPKGAVAITVGTSEIVVHPGDTELVPGVEGQPAFAEDGIGVGDTIEAIGVSVEGSANRLLAFAIRPSNAPPVAHLGRDNAWFFLFFPLTASLVGLALLLMEMLVTRNWRRMIVRSIVGGFLAALFSVLSMIPAGLVFVAGEHISKSGIQADDKFYYTISDYSIPSFLVHAACRSMAWALVGIGLGLGMNLVGATRVQLRNSVLGGALGGAFGGLFFDPIDRFFAHGLFGTAAASRLVGVVAVGIAVGVFVALVERLGREAWLKVLTGPLAGKSFVIYRTPTRLGSSPDADIYLYKDADIDAEHAVIHRVGTSYDLEDVASRTGTRIGDHTVRRRRLASGDQITIGGTVLLFEERAQRRGEWTPQHAR